MLPYCIQTHYFILLMILPITFRFKNWYQQILKWIFIVTNSVALAVNTADFVYYRFTLRRTTVSVFSQFKNEQNGAALFFQFVWDYWYMVLFWMGLVAMLIIGYKKIKYVGPQLENRWSFYIRALP
jgi:hypothetical protein